MIILAAATEMPTTIFGAEALGRFWFYVGWITVFLMPIIMICMAAMLSEKFLDMILGIFGYTTDRKDNDNDDYDTHYY